VNGSSIVNVSVFVGTLFKARSVNGIYLTWM